MIIHLIVEEFAVLRRESQKISETITVRSIVGRFLEHSRVYYFYAGGQEEVF